MRLTYFQRRYLIMQSTRYPSEAFGYLLGIALYRQSPFHLLLPKWQEPEVRFPILPEMFSKRLHSSGSEFRNRGSATPPRLPLYEVINRLEGDLPEINFYVGSDIAPDSKPDFGGIEAVQVSETEKIPERALLVSTIKCRSIRESRRSVCLIEENPYSTASMYIRRELNISPDSGQNP